MDNFPDLSLLHLAVGSRRHPHHLSEKPRKIIGISNTNLMANLIDFYIREIEQTTSMLYFELIKISHRRIAGAL